MQIFITGGTGLVGNHLIKRLVADHHSVTLLTRDINKAIKIFGADVRYCGSLHSFSSFHGYDAVINLSGEPLAEKRWTKKQKRVLCESRWSITEHLVQLILASAKKPKIFISGSAVGYYGSRGVEVLNEKSKPVHEFTNELCEKWEALALQAQSEQTRVCLLRTGIVLDCHSGALAKMLPPFKFYAGAVLGSGHQYMSWIHIEDMVEGIVFLLNSENAKGAFNMTAPNPVTNQVFSFALARVLNKPCFFRIHAPLLSLAMGEVATLLVEGQRVVPERLLKYGYSFKFSKIDDALKNLF